MVGLYSRLIPNLAEIKLPLTELTKQGEEWRWKEPRQKSFSELETLSTQASILARPDPSKPFTLQTLPFLPLVQY